MVSVKQGLTIYGAVCTQDATTRIELVGKTMVVEELQSAKNGEKITLLLEAGQWIMVILVI